MRKDVGLPTSVLLLIFCVLFAIATASPASIPPANANLLGVGERPSTSAGISPLIARVPFRYQDIILTFTTFGKAIPEAGVKESLIEAETITAESLNDYPEQGIPNNEFEYCHLEGAVFIAIEGVVGKEISWRQLLHVLQALNRFIVDLKFPLGPHYQELDFDIEIASKPGILGSGVIGALLSGSDVLQRRAITPPSSVANTTPLQLANASSLWVDRGSNEDIPYPVYGTSITLVFYFLGLGLPHGLVKANLDNALRKILPFTVGPHRDDTIKDNRFHHITEGAQVSVATTVKPSNGNNLTWSQLYNALSGMQQFVIGIGQPNPHFQTLACRIFDEAEGKIGVGTLSYLNYRQAGMKRRAMATSAKFMGPGVPQISALMNSTSLDITDHPPIPWPIPGTNLALTFTLYGEPIPLIELLTLLGVVQLKIAADVQYTPNAPIPNGRFVYENGARDVALHLVAYIDSVITWQQVSQIIVGLTQYCNDDHSQGLVFEIGLEGGAKIGVGTIVRVSSPDIRKVVGRRASNTKNSYPPDAAYFPTSLVARHPHWPVVSDKPELAARGPEMAHSTSSDATAKQPGNSKFPIPGTSITLNIAFIGRTIIQPVDLSATLTSALQVIRPHLRDEYDQAIPGNQWYYGNKMTNIWFGIVIFAQRTLSWQQLSSIIVGLLYWMTGPGASDCKTLTFNVEREGQGLIGIGSVLSENPGITGIMANISALEVNKRNIHSESVQAAEFVDEGNTPQQTSPVTPWARDVTSAGTIPSTLANPTLEIERPFPIPGTAITITLSTLFPTYIPEFSVHERFDGARDVIQSKVDQQPHGLLPDDYSFEYKVPYTQPGFVVLTLQFIPGCAVTWMQLDQILRGLDRIMAGDFVKPYLQVLNFAVHISLQGYLAVGRVGYYSSPPSTLETRSTSPPLEANTTVAIPYPIPSTPITLQVSVLPTTIPAYRLTQLFDSAINAIIPSVLAHPNDTIYNHFFYHRVNYPYGRELAIELHPNAGGSLTWMQLFQVLKGVHTVAAGDGVLPFGNSVSFKVDIEGRGWVATGLLSYLSRPTNTTLEARSVPPPPQANLTTPIPYPIIGTPITLAFTSLYPKPIPAAAVYDFFAAVIASIQDNLYDRSGRTIKFKYSFTKSYPATSEKLTVVLHRKFGKSITYMQLFQIMTALEDFMDGKWTATTHFQACAFNVEIVQKGVVGTGVLEYEVLNLLVPAVSGEMLGSDLVGNATSVS